jgi:hypothetical protein
MKKSISKLQGKISPWRYRDAISGNEIEITVSHLYTTIRINKRYYYFRVEDGIFDGTSTDIMVKPSSDTFPNQEQRRQSSCDQPA